MVEYAPPVRDSRFVLEHVLKIGRLADLPGFAEATAGTVAAVLEEGGRFAAEVLFPLNRIGDRHGCVRHKDGSVATPPGFRNAYRRFVAAGWGTLSAPKAYGGLGLPHVVSTAAREYLVGANMAFAMYPGLSRGAVAALLAKGTAAQRATYLPRLISGEWSGTMNLTEPHCGTDLSLIRTRADPQADGSYRITGTKIFVSAGEHDLTSNIVHLVLARIPGAPDGSRGLSLFVVPKFLPDDEGSAGARNAVFCGSIEEKMGIHGNATCAMHFDCATGSLVGEANGGLPAMFVMMNAARLGVGLQGLGVAEAAYQNAVGHAGSRRQGRAPAGPAEPDEQADTLFVHADVRRMLMEGKALTEGLRALCLWGALQVDVEQVAATEEEREEAGDLLGLLTPVIKGYATDMGLKVAIDAQQVHGGHGYIRDSGVEQYLRDVRITQIYEGANGVQAMDLVGRKLGRNDGRAIRAFMRLVGDEIAAARGEAATADLAARLEQALGDLRAATDWLAANGGTDPDHAGAGAMSYLHLLGMVATGLMWLRMAGVAGRLKVAGSDDPAFLDAKLVTARFFGERILPDTTALRRKIEGGAAAIMALPVEMFRPA